MYYGQCTTYQCIVDVPVASHAGGTTSGTDGGSISMVSFEVELDTGISPKGLASCEDTLRVDSDDSATDDAQREIKTASSSTDEAVMQRLSMSTASDSSFFIVSFEAELISDDGSFSMMSARSFSMVSVHSRVSDDCAIDEGIYSLATTS
jgi:hypothetical protein